MITKNYFNQTAKLIAGLFAIGLLFSACSKTNNDDPIEAAGIGFVHASPGTGPLDIIINNSQKLVTVNYTNDKGYYTAYPGTSLLGVVKKDSTKYITTAYAALKPGSFYSAFVVDTLKSTKFLIVEDDLKVADTTKAKVRFINLSPGSAPFDLVIGGKDSTLFSNKAFKEFTPFTSISPADNYTFQIRPTGSTTVRASLSPVKIQKGKVYTIWAKGLSSATDSTATGIAIMTNK